MAGVKGQKSHPKVAGQGRQARSPDVLRAINSQHYYTVRAKQRAEVRLEALQKKPAVAAIHIPDSDDLESLITTIPNFDPFLDAGDCRFDVAKAKAAIDFFQTKLVLVEGRDAGKPFVLQPHQRARIANLYGWRRPDGTRRFRQAYISEARKNGKTATLAGMVAMELTEPVEDGSQIYSAASERAQARLIYRQVAGMAQRAEYLKPRLQVWKHSIVNVVDDLTSYVALSAEASSAHGLNPQFVAFDELHLQTSRDLWDALTSGMVARDQPLLVAITTAGYDRESICWEIYQYAKAVLSKGEARIADPEFFPDIRELEECDDWTDESSWPKANPNLGVTIKVEALRAEYRKAVSNAAKQNKFRQLHCNQWTQQAVRWLNMAEWDLCKCVDEVPAGAKCYGGLDLGIRRDLTAFVLVFKLGGRVVVRPWFWAPADNIEERKRTDHVPYDTWAAKGLIELTPGRTTDYEYVRAKINELGQRYKIVQIGYDPANADQLAKQLGEADGFDMVLVRQGFLHMSEPSKLLEKMVLDASLVHDGNAILRSHAEYAAVDVHRTGLIMPTKSKSTGRIDGIVALIMALKLSSLDVSRGRVYEKRGVRFA